MKGQLFKFYKVIEKNKANLANPYMTAFDKLVICLAGLSFVCFAILIATQIVLVCANTLPLWVPIVTLVVWLVVSKLMQMKVDEIFDKVAFEICEYIEENLYGDEKKNVKNKTRNRP